MAIFTQVYNSPAGRLLLGDYYGELCLCDWIYRKKRAEIEARILHKLDEKYEEKNTDLLEQTSLQLNEYFKGQRKIFELPTLFCGTDFQKKVWTLLTEIPFGETRSYKQMALKIADEKIVRALAAANGANALSIVVPCHRIIGSSGELVGYAGGLAAKRKLLEIEGHVYSQQLDLFGA